MLLRQCFGFRKSKTLPSHRVSIVDSDETGKSKFECLPNELIFVLFDYLQYQDIMYAFINLNNRFQSLLHEYPSYYMNNSPQLTISKFELIQESLLNIEHVKSLTLFYRPDSMIDTDQFLSVYPIDLFYTKLEALSLHLDRDLPTSLILLLPNFQQLNYLSICARFNPMTPKEEFLFDIILFKIRTLKYFKSNVQFAFPSINYGKSTIEDIHLCKLSFDELKWLYLHTFNIKSMSIEEILYRYNDYQLQIFEGLVSLKLNNLQSIKHIQWIFKHSGKLSQLKRLEFQGDLRYTGRFIDGYRLEDLIKQYIPQLKTFKFFFSITCYYSFTNIKDSSHHFKLISG